MTTFNQSFPKNNPFTCFAALHFRTERGGSWLLLAVYDFMGRITLGGKRSFYSSFGRVAILFYGKVSKSNYETVRRAFRTLRKMGWLKKVDGKWYYVDHESWAMAHPDQCRVRELLPWQGATDPFVGKLWSIADGKIRVYENTIKAIRKMASDEEFLREFEQEMESAKARRAAREYEGTSPKACFWKVFRLFKGRYEKHQGATRLESSEAA